MTEKEYALLQNELAVKTAHIEVMESVTKIHHKYEDLLKQDTDLDKVRKDKQNELKIVFDELAWMLEELDTIKQRICASSSVG